jgi:hypothetical protein
MTELTATEQAVLNAINGVAELIVGYNIYVCDDGGGPYISMNNPEDEEAYRCLSLHDRTDSCSEDLSLYRWHFWNSGAANVWLDSELGADATQEEVMAFLSESLVEEARHLAALC